MKKLKKKILSTFLILIVLSLVLKSDALAKDITVAKDEVVQGPYIQTGNNITISGTINGDAYLAGGTATIDGVINGDLIIAGGAVTIKGEVTNDVRAGGGMVTIDGKVGRNVTAIGGTVTLGSDADVDGGVIALGGTLAHLGNIDGDVLAYGNRLTLAGRVGGNTTANVQTVSVTKTALLDGGLNYTSDQEASVSAEAKISGPVRRTPTGKALTQVVPQTGRRVVFGFNLLSYLSMLLLGLVLLRLVPRQVIAVSQLIGEQPWRGLGLGLLAMVLAPILVIILVVSIIGMPLAVILVGLYVLMIATSSLFTGLFVGQKVFDLMNLKENRYAMFAVGLLLLQLLLSITTVGMVVRFLSVLAASGAMLTLGREALARLGVKAK